MKLTPEELRQLPRPFQACQARAVAGSEPTRTMQIVAPYGYRFVAEDEWVELQPGEEVELVPAADYAPHLRPSLPDDDEVMPSVSSGGPRHTEPSPWQKIGEAPPARAIFWLEWADDCAPLNPPMAEIDHVFLGWHRCWSSVFKATHWQPLPPPPECDPPEDHVQVVLNAADNPQPTEGLQIDRSATLVGGLDPYLYAKNIARILWERHYKADAPRWEPLPDLNGVLSQIDNMTTGMSRHGFPPIPPSVLEARRLRALLERAGHYVNESANFYGWDSAKRLGAQIEEAIRSPGGKT